jgi:hypothetical protein
MMNTLAKDFQESNIEYTALTIEENTKSENFTEDLKNIGRENGSKSNFS